MNTRRLPSFERIMIFAGLLSFGFLFYRCIFTANFHYTFLLWNLVLAFVPYAISKKLINNKGNKLTNYLLVLSWLLFFPACIYPLTDLFQLKQTDNFSMAYDLIMFLSFAVAGLLPGLVSLKTTEGFLKEHFSGGFAKLSLLFFIFLSSYSACLVRFLHLKSWNVVNDFKKMFLASEHGILDPFDHFRIIASIVAIVLVVDVLYAGFMKINKKPARVRS
jgi:uncharacterized membrane protein